MRLPFVRCALAVIFVQQFASAPSFAQAPDNQAQADIRRLLSINGAFDGVEKIADDVVPLFVDPIKVARPDLPERFFVVLKEVVRAEMARMFTGTDSIQEDYVKLYAEHFSEADITSMLAFYESPVGRKVAAFQPVLRQESIPIARRWLERNTPRISAEIEKQLKAFKP